MSGGYCSAFAMSKDPSRPQLEVQHVIKTLVYVPVLLWCRELYCARVLTPAQVTFTRVGGDLPGRLGCKKWGG